MEFDVLGPLRVRAAGQQPAPLTAQMPRTLLAILLIRANRTVPADVLVDALWAGRRDPRAVKKLHLHVHRLRRGLGDPRRVRFEHGGYALRLHPGELDAQRFEQLLTEGLDTPVPGEATALLRSALGLWHGDAFGDVADVALVRAEADRLTERRLAGLEGLYAAELAAGNAALVVPELGELAGRHPLRERLQGLLMTALCQTGRRAEALDVYHRARTVLVEELALDPGPELQRLEHAILTGGPALDCTPIVLPAQLPPDIADFTGRGPQLDTVAQHLATAPERADAPAVLAISGKAGVGKTTLAVHAAHRLREHYPHGQLYADLRGAQAQPLDATEVLARFLRALGVPGSALPEGGAERAALYRSLLADRRMLILLDNAASREQVWPLLPAAAGCGVLVTSRTRPAALAGARLLDLDILEPGQAVELLTRVVGAHRVGAEPGTAAEIARLCGYLPLAVRVAAVRLSARPHWRLAQLATGLADEHRRLDELRLGDLEVRASLALSYQSLDETGRRVFRRFGLLGGTDAPAWVGAALLGSTRPGAEPTEALVDAQLLDAAGPDAAGQHRYRCHDLLRAYARELVTALEPGTAHRHALTRVFGGWLALADAAGARMASPVFGVTVDCPSTGESRPAWRPDADTVDLVIADPAAWFQAEWPSLLDAVHHAHRQGFDQFVCALGVRMAPFYTVRGHYDDWQRICALMLESADRLGDRRWTATALRGLAELALVRHELDTAAEAFGQARAAFRAAGDPHGEAVTVLGIGAVHVEAGRFGDALPLLLQALSVFREVGDRRSEGWALRRLGTLHRLRGHLEQAVICLHQALRALDEGADPLGTAGVLERLGNVRTVQGHRRQAAVLLERSLRLRREHADRFGAARTLRSLADLHCAAAEWSPALRCLAAALRLWRQLRLPREQADTLARMGAVYQSAGRAAAAQRMQRAARLLSAAPGAPGNELCYR